MRRIAIGFAASLGLVVLLAALAIVWPLAEAPLPDPGRDRLIVNARVIDTENGTIGAPTRVLIRGGRIAAIGPGVAGGKAPVLDARGGYLLPGFWDMHVHHFQLSPQLHQPLFIANGVTGVRDMMDCPEVSDALIACVADKRRWNQEVAEGRRAAPRIVEVASFYFERPDMTPAEVTAAANRYKARGLDALKVYNRLPRASYARLAQDARRLGLPLIGHLPKAVSLEDALAAGQVSFEHAHLFPRHCFARNDDWRAGALDGTDPVGLVESIVAQQDPARCARAYTAMRDADAWFVPTHVTREEDARAADPRFAEDGRLAFLDPLSRWAYRDDFGATAARYPGARGEAALKAYFDLGLRQTGEAHRAGVRVLVGTDTAIGGFRYHDEMAHLVRAGLSEAAVLRAATLDAARYAGMDGRYGSVAVGKTADLVLLDANPLVDIRNTRRVRAVLMGGRLYDRQRLDSLLDFVKDQAGAPSNWVKLVWGFATSSVSGEL